MDQLKNHWTEIFGINSHKTMAETEHRKWVVALES